MAAYIKGPDFELAGFKGQKLTFRAWNGQLRQPVLLAGPKALVSVSPQERFLHQRSQLDTLGYDEPESACRMQ
jgi:ABC transporter substrate binding protein (PQQ-dependent alcohol dehydrogenase system)